MNLATAKGRLARPVAFSSIRVFGTKDLLEFNPNIYLNTEVQVSRLSQKSICSFTKQPLGPQTDTHAFHLSNKSLKCLGPTGFLCTSSHAETVLRSSQSCPRCQGYTTAAQQAVGLEMVQT